jgi:hypothetical protein
MSQSRDSLKPRDKDAEAAEQALLILVRLLGRQAARETFERASSPHVQDSASEPPLAPSANHPERMSHDHQ